MDWMTTGLALAVFAAVAVWLVMRGRKKDAEVGASTPSAGMSGGKKLPMDQTDV